MDRQQFILVTAAALFAAFVIGWFAASLVHRLFRATRAEPDLLDSLARQLHDAEAAHAAAEQREAELAARLDIAEAEAQTAINGLHESRSEVEELRDYIEKRLARNRGAQS